MFQFHVRHEGDPCHDPNQSCARRCRRAREPDLRRLLVPVSHRIPSGQRWPLLPLPELQLALLASGA